MLLILREKINLAIIKLRISVDQKNNMQWEENHKPGEDIHMYLAKD